VTPAYASSFREVGFKDIPMKKLVEMKIHGVTANFIRERKDRGDYSLDDYIKLKIHGL
jgi:hypothetical protein